PHPIGSLSWLRLREVWAEGVPPAVVVQLPASVSPSEGDTLTVQTEFGLLHVPVPGGAVGGQRLEVQGMVEVGLPQQGMPRWVQSAGAGEWQHAESWEVGDVVAVNMPEGRVARVQIPEDAREDGLLRILGQRQGGRHRSGGVATAPPPPPPPPP
ncbi:unnamed protein product, partial [Prorocentrum cordatum]